MAKYYKTIGLFFVICALMCSTAIAQTVQLGTLSDAIDSVIVEPYYRTDSKDASDTTGGIMQAGTNCYRIFIDLKPNVRLLRIWANENHPIRFASSEPFYNHSEEGQTYGFDFNKNRLKEGLVALDTWFSINVVSKKPYYAVLKTEDTDGSIIGGRNNDGGSAGVDGGLLVNASGAGIPLTTADGLITETIDTAAQDVTVFGIETLGLGTDSTIFGSLVSKKEFSSKKFDAISSSGMVGPTTTNRILVAQLTTKGTLSFSLNLLVYDPSKSGVDSVGRYYDNGLTRIVASDSAFEWTDNGVKLVEQSSPWLRYPFSCGCSDPRFAEYNPRVARHDSLTYCKTKLCGCSDPRYLEYDSRYGTKFIDTCACKTRKIFGCMDPWACNYDRNANMPLKNWCCYPGNCNNREISLVCPAEYGREPMLFVFPNPAQTTVKVEVYPQKDVSQRFTITNTDGHVLFEQSIGTISEVSINEVNVSQFQDGIYCVNLQVGDQLITKKFTKVH